MRLKNYSVAEFFNILKSKKDAEISLVDFVSACQSQVTNLSQLDLQSIFQAMDRDDSNSVSIEEVETEFADLSAVIAIGKLQENVVDIKMHFDSVDSN